MAETFILSEAILSTLTNQAVDAICTDLQELDMFHLPYPEVNIIVDANCIFQDSRTHKPFKDKHINTYVAAYNVSQSPSAPLPRIEILFRRGAKRWQPLWQIPRPGIQFDPADFTQGLIDTLIALLSTRNIEQVISSPSGLTLKKKNHKTLITFPFTTLKIGTPVENGEDTDVGISHASPRPHLRRGHIRRQNYGLGRNLQKKIWIAPVFVNASEHVTATRQAYSLV